MRIKVVLNPILAELYGPRPGQIDLPDSARVADLARALSLPAEAAVFVAGGRMALDEDELHDGDEIIALPHLGGG